MARAMMFVGGLACGFMLATGVLAGHADDVQAEVLEAARVAKVDPIQLQGALNMLEVHGLPADPYSYLRSTGELAPPPREPVLVPPSNSRIECIIRVESRGNPNAHNPSGASGLGQFLPSTWATTPQGKAGISVYNPAANRAAIAWMINVGRAREFDAVRYFGC